MHTPILFTAYTRILEHTAAYCRYTTLLMMQVTCEIYNIIKFTFDEFALKLLKAAKFESHPFAFARKFYRYFFCWPRVQVPAPHALSTGATVTPSAGDPLTRRGGPMLVSLVYSYDLP